MFYIQLSYIGTYSIGGCVYTRTNTVKQSVSTHVKCERKILWNLKLLKYIDNLWERDVVAQRPSYLKSPHLAHTNPVSHFLVMWTSSILATEYWHNDTQ